MRSCSICCKIDSWLLILNQQWAVNYRQLRILSFVTVSNLPDDTVIKGSLQIYLLLTKYMAILKWIFYPKKIIAKVSSIQTYFLRSLLKIKLKWQFTPELRVFQFSAAPLEYDFIYKDEDFSCFLTCHHQIMNSSMSQSVHCSRKKVKQTSHSKN